MRREPETVLKGRGSDRYKGLSAQAVLTKRTQYGWNELPSTKEKPIWRIAWEVVQEPMFLILAACAGLYLLLGDVKEGLILMAQVFIVIGITLYQERKTEHALAAIRDLSSPRAYVIRDGVAQRIAGREVVVGDIIILQEGDRVPADAKVLESLNLSVEESLLTGESVPVRKSVWQAGEHETTEKHTAGGDDMPFVYSATMLVQGQGLGKVYAVGTQTEIGKIGKSLETVIEEKTLLQIEIRQLVRFLGILGFVISVIAVVTFGILRGAWLQGLLAALSLSLAMLPEEFPVILTIFMALGAWRMSRKNVLARRVATIETLGSATVLCTDKTGTITQNKMQVEQLFAQDAFWDFTKNAYQDFPEAFHELIEYGMLASQTDPFDPMERAILKCGQDYLLDTEHIHADWKLKKEHALSKELFAMSRIFAKPQSKHFAIATKGAPEAILDLCHLDKIKHAQLSEVGTILAKEGLRVLGVAKAEFKTENLPNHQHDYDFEFVGFIALSDPIREEVPQAVKECYEAGIRVIMITGDYAATAQHIARQIGLKNPDNVVSGKEMSAMDDAILRGVSKEINVFSRMVPEQKLRLVNTLKANGEIVAMTGDGVNDAPALKAAHIGIAMGGKGTDVARETASLVLLDDNFTSIVSAVKMGRRIFDNLQKAMVYVFAIHMPIISLSILPMMTSFLPLMLMPIHIAFMELIIDPACSIVFEAEGSEADSMKRPPRPIRARFFSYHKIRLGVLQGLGLSLAVLAVYFLGWIWYYDDARLRTMTFTTLLIANLSLILTNRSRRKTILESLFTMPNPTVGWIIAAVLFLVFAVNYIPFVMTIFKTRVLTFSDFAIAFLAGMASVAWFEVVKIFHKQ